MTDSPCKQLIYASTATIGRDLSHPETQRELMKIVSHSRRANPNRGIVGVLHFGQGKFLQILEGQPEAVDALFEKIQQDPRNSDIEILRDEGRDEPRFGEWNMKFLTLAEEMDAFLKRHRLNAFDPYRLDDRMLTDLVELLASGQDEGAPAVA
jgi:hypothetical protein